MERLLNQNTYQPKQARYRGLKPLEFPTEGISSYIELMYSIK